MKTSQTFEFHFFMKMNLFIKDKWNIAIKQHITVIQ